MNLDNLKPCPFCGKSPEVFFERQSIFYEISCLNVDCVVKPRVMTLRRGSSKRIGLIEAIEIWNTRYE